MPESKPAGRTTPPKQLTASRTLNNDGYKESIYLMAEAGVPLPEVVRRVKADYITAALRLERGNATKAAERIGVHRNTLPRNRNRWEKE